ncbi:MAG: hypothetical protein V4622_03620 [Bacteroidota bacterium]
MKRNYYNIISSFLVLLIFSSCSTYKMHKGGYKAIKRYKYSDYYFNKNDEKVIEDHVSEIEHSVFLDNDKNSDIRKRLGFITPIDTYDLEYQLERQSEIEYLHFYFSYPYYSGDYKDTQITINHARQDTLNEISYSIKIDKKDTIFTLTKDYLNRNKDEVFQLSPTLIKMYTNYCIKLKDSIDFLPVYDFPDISSCTQKLKSYEEYTRDINGHRQLLKINGQLIENEFVFDTTFIDYYKTTIHLDDRTVFLSKEIEKNIVKIDSTIFFKNENIIKNVFYVVDTITNDILLNHYSVLMCTEGGIYQLITQKGNTKILANSSKYIEIKEKQIERLYDEEGNILTEKIKVVSLQDVEINELTNYTNKKGYRKSNSQTRLKGTKNDRVNFPYYDGLSHISYYINERTNTTFEPYNYYNYIHLLAEFKKVPFKPYKKPFFRKIKIKSYKHIGSSGGGLTKLVSRNKKTRTEKRIEQVHSSERYEYEIQFK